jgi:hypothetical protein
MLLQEVQSGHNVGLYKTIGEIFGDKLGVRETPAHVLLPPPSLLPLEPFYSTPSSP